MIRIGSIGRIRVLQVAACACSVSCLLIGILSADMSVAADDNPGRKSAGPGASPTTAGDHAVDPGEPEGGHTDAAGKRVAQTEAAAAPVQGPATSVPREILDMLEQRKRMLDKREVALHGAETHLLELKAELEQIVTRYEKVAETQKKRSEAAAKVEADRKAKEEKAAADTRNVYQAQLAKIYESMPPEEAALRLERMPERKAIEVLRLLKGKSAGAILSAIRPERAAHLTEQLLNVP
mgnify:CR=1 FL=1